MDSPTPTDTLVAFVEEASKVMLVRMRHGARKFGKNSWRRYRYDDEDNLARLRRAVDHLEAARANSDDPQEWAKRAADVANQAFMYADPERTR